MAYQIKRSEKITDVLELCDEGGNVVTRLDITIDIDSIAAELRKRLVNVQTAEKLLKRAASQEDYAEAYGLFGQTVNDVFSVCFGAENAKRITEHFGGDYIEMSLAVVPYIYEVVLPKVNEVVARRRTALKRIYNRR
ncbi:MAG: hypothetical protein ACI4RK_02330 [Oscillospiraceae bacterium]